MRGMDGEANEWYVTDGVQNETDSDPKGIVMEFTSWDHVEVICVSSI
jgi:hypothetical protein